MPLDRHRRPLTDLRISVTDRCNYRCTYCMPLAEYEWLHKSRILTFEEIARLARIAAGLGVRKIRLTGGEPLVRQDLPVLVQELAAIKGLDDLCLTTNGSRLAPMAGELKAAGLNRVTVSLDSLKPERFRAITQRGDLEPVLAGLEAADSAGLRPIKLNAVIERGVNDDEIVDLVEFGRTGGYDVRFIEYMDVGNANRWTSEKLVPKREILARVAERYPVREARVERGAAPAEDYEFVDGGGRFGVIASVTEPFCGACTRARLTADGQFVTCLFSDRGHDLKTLLREGATDAEIEERIRAIWERRTDRYSEQRLAALESPAGYDAQSRRKLEMISLGG